MILTLKSVSPSSGEINCSVINLIRATIKEAGIHLQLEEIDDGLLLFWQTQDDFVKTTRLLVELGANLPEPPLWEKGYNEWELSILKPVEQQEGQLLLEESRTLIFNMFGAQTATQVTHPRLTFRLPTLVKVFEELWKYFRLHIAERSRK